MQVFYCGLPGAGKSHEMVRTEVLPALKARRMIVTNMPLQMERIYQDFPESVGLVHVLNREAGGPYRFAEAGDYLQYADWRHPEDPGMGPLYVIDEAHKPLPPAGKGRVPGDVLEFYKEHRHYGAKIVLAAQQFEDVEKSIRMLTETVFGMKQLGFLGLSKHFWRRTYFGPVAPSKGRKPDSKESRRYDKAIFGYYKSHMHGGGVVNEVRQRIWFLRKRMLVILAVAILFVVKSILEMSGDTSRATAAPVQRQPVSVMTAASSAPAGAVETVPSRPFAGQPLLFGGMISVGEARSVDDLIFTVGHQRLTGRALLVMGYSVDLIDGGTAVIRYDDLRWVVPLGTWVRL